MTTEYQPGIDALEQELASLERQRNALRMALNVLYAKAGLPPRYPAGGGGGNTAAPAPTEEASQASSIRSDTFYGKRMGTAAREYLEMRLAQNAGPARPREVYDALLAGGFQFEAKDETVAMVSLRAMLRKNTVTFHRLPNGAYGLKAWYPNARPSKADEEADSPKERAEPTKSGTSKKDTAA